MPDILPFRAIHYPWGVDFSQVSAPPYDVISPEEREALRASHENNVIRITLGGDHSGVDDGKYEAAGSLWRQWLADGVLVRDEEPLFFLYGMGYEAGGAYRTTLGLVAALGLEDYESGEIYPHERTIPGPIHDRLQLMRTTEANLEPLWFFASSRIDGMRSLMDTTRTQPPVARVTDRAAVDHSLWPVSPDDAKQVVESLSRTPLVIADGHHRYETALAYRDERRKSDGPGPWDRILALIVDPVDYPALLLPIHRLVENMSVGQVAEWAAEAYAGVEGDGDGARGGDGGGAEGPESASVPLRKVNPGVADLVKMVEEAGPGTIGVVAGPGAWLMSTRGELDTVFLNDSILEPSGAAVRYEHDEEEVEKAVARGALGFILAPAPIELVAAKALAGERMPPKTTLFWPKPRTGLVMRDLSEPQSPDL